MSESGDFAFACRVVHRSWRISDSVGEMRNDKFTAMVSKGILCSPPRFQHASFDRTEHRVRRVREQLPLRCTSQGGATASGKTTTFQSQPETESQVPCA